MSKSRTLSLAMGLAVAGLLTVVSPSVSQEVVTLALVNGERPSGELIDLNAKGFTLRVSGENRSFAASEVAAVEFVVGPPSAQAAAALTRGQPVVVLRNGQVIEGRLTDIGGTKPLRVTVDTASGSRDFPSNEVAQVHLRQTAQAASSGTNQVVGTGGEGAAIAVPANTPWTDTNIVVVRGERVMFDASGDIMVAAQASGGVGGADIAPSGRLPLSNGRVGALIGRIGTGQPFLIGANDQAIVMPASGRLQLGINDEHFADNTGAFSVVVTRRAGAAGNAPWSR